MIFVELTSRFWRRISFSLIKVFKLWQKYAVDRPIFKYEYIRHTPPSLNLVNGEKNQTFFDKPRENCANLLKDSYIEIVFFVTATAGVLAWYAGVDHIRLVSSCPIA